MAAAVGAAYAERDLSAAVALVTGGAWFVLKTTAFVAVLKINRDVLLA